MAVKRTHKASIGKVQRGVKPRTSVRPRQKRDTQPERILDRFYEDSNFIATTPRRTEEKPTVTEVTDSYRGKITVPGARYMKGIMYSRAEVSVLRRVSRMTDAQVYDELDALAKRGHIGITTVNLKPSSVRICVVIGEAMHTGHRLDAPHVTRSYKSDPLTEGERKRFIQNVREAIKEAGDAIQKEMERRHGTPGGEEVERQMRKEDREERSERHALFKAITEALTMEARE